MNIRDYIRAKQKAYHESTAYLDREWYSLEVIKGRDDAFLHFENMNGAGVSSVPRQWRSIAG